MKQHVTIMQSRSGERSYCAYGPPTKEKEKATLFTTNKETMRAPWEFGISQEPFWQCEREARDRAVCQSRGCKWKHFPCDRESIPDLEAADMSDAHSV